MPTLPSRAEHTALRTALGLRLRRYGVRAVLGLAAVITAMMLVLTIGMWSNDRAIDAHPVTTTATVLAVSPLRTGIEFLDTDGAARRPTAGVLYPGGLTVGRQFLVEYAADDPDLVRVAGRSWVNGVIMPVGVVVITWVLAVPLVLWLRRRLRSAPPAARPAALATT